MSCRRTWRKSLVVGRVCSSTPGRDGEKRISLLPTAFNRIAKEMMNPHLVQQSGKVFLRVASVSVIIFLALPLQLRRWEERLNWCQVGARFFWESHDWLVTTRFYLISRLKTVPDSISIVDKELMQVHASIRIYSSLLERWTGKVWHESICL